MFHLSGYKNQVSQRHKCLLHCTEIESLMIFFLLCLSDEVAVIILQKNLSFDVTMY